SIVYNLIPKKIRLNECNLYKLLLNHKDCIINYEIQTNDFMEFDIPLDPILLNNFYSKYSIEEMILIKQILSKVDLNLLKYRRPKKSSELIFNLYYILN